jgi:hypothetical protein
MSLDLASANSKIERGYEQLQALHSEVVTWVQRYPYGLRHDVQAEGRRHAGILEVYRPPDSTRFGLLIGDSAQNFRAALDHLVFSVASANLPEAELAAAEDRLAFPITTTPEKWKGAAERGLLEGLGSGVRAEVDRKQPYHADDPTETVLYALHWLNNRDKHRILHAVAAFPQVATIDFIPELPGPSEGGVAPPPYEHGTEVFWARSAEPCPDMQVKADILVEIRVRETPIAEDIRELLLKIGQTVQRIVANVAKAQAEDSGHS